MMQLLLKTLLGQNLGLITITCNHCAHRGCWIEALKDGNGHWVYCPKCKKTDVHVFPEGYDNCMNTIKLEIAKRRNQSPIKISPDCKNPIEEIQSYKYEHGKRIATHANPSTIIKYEHAAKNINNPGENPKPKKPSKGDKK